MPSPPRRLVIRASAKASGKPNRASPADALPEVALGDVPELVSENEADLPVGEAARRGACPRPRPASSGRGRPRTRSPRVVTLLTLSTSTGVPEIPSRPFERLHVLAQLGSLRRVDRQRQVGTGATKSARADSADEDRGHRQPPVARVAPRKRHHDRDLEHHEDDLAAELRPRAATSQSTHDPSRGRAADPTSARDRERQVRRPEDGDRDRTDDDPGADRAQPRPLAQDAERAARATSSATTVATSERTVSMRRNRS